MAEVSGARSFAQRFGIPFLGYGIGLRRKHFDAILQALPDLPENVGPALGDSTRTYASRVEREPTGILGQVDWLEIVSENYMAFGGRPQQVLDRCAEHFPILPHGVNLSIGSPDPLCADYLSKLKLLCNKISAPFWSDHCCYTSVGGSYFHDLLPLPFTDEAIRHVARRARDAMDYVECPIALENISYYAKMPQSSMQEAEFLSAVLEEADCGLLLDINNVYVNSINHEEDPIRFLDSIPLSRVVQVHLAGHRDEGWLRVDDHGSPVSEPVWALYAELVRRIGPVTTVIEWDNHIPDLSTLINQAEIARKTARLVNDHPLSGEAR